MTKDEARKKASAPMQKLLDADVVAFISRHHFVHHARKGGCNFNLLPGGDFLRGQAQAPTAEERALFLEDHVQPGKVDYAGAVLAGIVGTMGDVYQDVVSLGAAGAYGLEALYHRSRSS